MTCYFRDRGDEKLPPYLHTTPKNVNEAFLASSCRKNIACKEGISSFLPPFPALHRTQTTHSCSSPNSSTQKTPPVVSQSVTNSDASTLSASASVSLSLSPPIFDVTPSLSPSSLPLVLAAPPPRAAYSPLPGPAVRLVAHCPVLLVAEKGTIKYQKVLPKL